MIRPDWMDLAPCNGLTSLMYPELGRGDDAGRAKAVCAPCPHRRVCLEWAIDHHENWGVWGGMSAKERKDEITRRRRAAA